MQNIVGPRITCITINIVNDKLLAHLLGPAADHAVVDGIIVAAEQLAQGIVDVVAHESVADQGDHVGVEALPVSDFQLRSQDIAQSTADDVGHLILCDGRVICRHHHNRVLLCCIRFNTLRHKSAGNVPALRSARRAVFKSGFPIKKP